MNKRRIWIDQDSTIYDIFEYWLAQHNTDYPNHQLTVDSIDSWLTQEVCILAGCDANIFSYFDHPELWINGNVIDGAKVIIDHWHKQGIADLGVLTTASNTMSMPHKVEWVQKHFPYITDIVINHRTHIKHLLRGDILIDDGLHNLEHWEGIGILYSQPWNKNDDYKIRANNWDDVDWLVRRSFAMLDLGMHHKEVEWVLISEQNIRRGKM